MVADLAAYILSSAAIDMMTTRYLLPFTVFGAVLAGREGVPAIVHGLRAWAGELDWRPGRAGTTRPSPTLCLATVLVWAHDLTADLISTP